MISHQLHSAHITGYYEYLSRIRQRVNVAPHEASDNEETTSQTTLITSPSVASVMNNDNTASVNNSSNGDNLQQQPASFNDKDVPKWSSNEVYQWVEEQCQKFELKKATTEKFQMNGQALVLLTKHDFLRRSPDGGEILYYALQRLINPNKNNSVRVAQNFTKNGSWRQSARIVELDSDTDEHNSSISSPSSSSKPIIEEPDDPPLYNKSTSGTLNDKHQHQNYSHPFFHGNGHIRQPFYGIPTAAFYHQQQAYPNGYMYAQHIHPHHVHPHMSQQQFFHPHQHSHYTQQFHPMMSTPGILIEVIDNEEAKNGTDPLPNENSTNGTNPEAQEATYMVTINGQRYIMNEEQVTQYVAEVHRQQQQQQQQQHFQQQQQFHQQQQQFHHHPHPQQQQQFHQQQQQQQQHRQTSQDSIFHNL